MTFRWVLDRVTPKNAEALVDLLREPQGPPLLPTGSGSRLGRGESPREPVRLVAPVPGAVIREHAHEDLTVTVDAGVPLADLRDAVAERGQWLPTSGWSLGGTVGGWIGCDHRGPLAGRWGSARDAVLGVRFLTGAGERVEAGGRVVKNVAGYDLMKLLVGSLGSLGIMEQVTLRLLPRPMRWQGRVWEADVERVEALHLAVAGGLRASALWLSGQDEGLRLAFLAAGTPESVNDLCRQADGICGAGVSLEEDACLEHIARWEGQTERVAAWGGLRSPGFRSVDLLAGTTPWVIDLLSGRFWCAAGPAEVPALRERIEGQGVLHWDAADEGAPVVPAWGQPGPPESDLWARLKQALDPRGRLVTGRFPGGG